MSYGNEHESGVKDSLEEESEGRESGEQRATGRKFCKTLDVAKVEPNYNLYTEVRQNLCKVNRISLSTLSPHRESKGCADRGGVSQESSVGRFSKIKALFDRREEKEDRCCHSRKLTVMGKLMQTLDPRKKSCNDDIEPRENELDINENTVLN
ncbi:hypothetical protein KM043_002850 [Ampulex compressa]|nr:hypothetical protein KM043_002850 [Ampulex compressa]